MHPSLRRSQRGHAVLPLRLLGTKTWTGDGWSEYTWEHPGWSGNEVEFEILDREKKEIEIFEPDGFELRLERSMLRDVGLGAETLRLAFLLERPTLTFPRDADDAPLRTWLPLHLEPRNE